MNTVLDNEPVCVNCGDKGCPYCGPVDTACRIILKELNDWVAGQLAPPRKRDRTCGGWVEQTKQIV